MIPSETVDAIATQIATEAHALLWPLAQVVGMHALDDALDGRALRQRAHQLALQLLDDREADDAIGVSSDDIAAETAQDIMCGLWPQADPPPEWWQTPLGRAVARSYGIGGSEAVSAAVAGSMLGVTRARVYQLLDDGKLDRHPDGGVVRASVARRVASSD